MQKLHGMTEAQDILDCFRVDRKKALAVLRARGEWTSEKHLGALSEQDITQWLMYMYLVEGPGGLDVTLATPYDPHARMKDRARRLHAPLEERMADKRYGV